MVGLLGNWNHVIGLGLEGQVHNLGLDSQSAKS